MAASVGGYALMSLACTVLALGLALLPGISRAEGVQAASLLSFAIYTALAVWAFGARTALRAWAVVLLAALVLGLCFGVLLWLGAWKAAV